MQILADDVIDDDSDLKDVSDADLAERALHWKELQISYPGLGALNFKIQFQIMMECVVGWDMRKNCATKLIGLFSKCIACTVAFKEQGRLTVHRHLCVAMD
jgi:hypothetical protein